MMTQTQNYSTVAKTLHWVIALMKIVQIPAGIVMHNLPYSEFKFTLYQLHKSSGFVVLILSLIRLGWRLQHPAPALPAGMKGWERVAARVTHVLFYVVIIGIPLTGWLMVSASTTGIPTKLFFVIPVPHLPVPQSEGLEEFFEESHEYMAKATIGLIVLHVGAALKHQFIARDDTLARMVPEPFARSLRARLVVAEKEGDPS